MSCRWSFNIIYFDQRLNNKQSVFAHLVIKYLRESYDPRRYESAKGYVEALGDFRSIGGENLEGFYKFKPNNYLRNAGLDIRIIFQVMIRNSAVHPDQDRLPKPSPSYCQIRILYIGPRDTQTYRRSTKDGQIIEKKSKRNKRVKANINVNNSN
jgi:hypothetical protein